MKLDAKKDFRKSFYLSIWDFGLFLIPILMSCLLMVFYFNILFQHSNSEGVKSLKNKDFNSAVQSFSQAVEEEPLNAWVHLNLSLTYDLLNNPLKSLQIYKLVSSQFINHPQFFSYFNQAELNGRLGFLDKALENYQKALDFKYKEKEIKENIELLFQNNKNKKDSKDKEDKSKDKKSSGKDQGGQKGKSDQEEEKDSSKKEANQGEENHGEKNVEKENKKEQDKNQGQEGQQRPDDLKKEQEKAILKAIERQEGENRAKAFKRKNQHGDKTKKDW